MKFKDYVLESIIDIPRLTYAPGVFDNANTSNPKIKASVKKLINNQIKEFEQDYPILKISLIGSILTKRYRNDADLDINVLFDVPKEKQEDERVALSQKYLSSKNPDNIQGKEIPGTKHPINFYFITDQETYDDQNKKADAVFDIEKDKFVKRPDDFVFNTDLYVKEFGRKVQELDVVKGELKRDIIDYDELKELQPNDVLDLQDKLNDKIEEIEDNLNDIIKIGDTVDAERRSAFDSDMSPDEIRKYGIKNKLPKNVIYKMLEKYHYLKFYKKCKQILDDGKVTDAEIDSLKTESIASAWNTLIRKTIKAPRMRAGINLYLKYIRQGMKDAKNKAAQHAGIDYNEFNLAVKDVGLPEDYVTEVRSGKLTPNRSGKTMAFTFGRFNPPTIGHEKLIKKVASQSANDYRIFLSRSQDSKKNPLDPNTKLRFMKDIFKQYSNKIELNSTNMVLDLATMIYKKDYENITMVVGSDRVNEFSTILKKYNGIKSRHGYYFFGDINVVSAGERDPDAEGAMGMSASKMRKAAAGGDFELFKKGLPPTYRSIPNIERLMKSVRQGMNLALESRGPVASMAEFEQQQIRDLYVREVIFNIGDKVNYTKEDLQGIVKRRGTNYIVLEDNSNSLHKAWIWDCIPISSNKEAAVREYNLDVDYGFKAVSSIEEVTIKVTPTQDKVISKKTKRFSEFKKDLNMNKDKKESYEIGHDYAKHTISLTPGQDGYDPNYKGGEYVPSKPEDNKKQVVTRPMTTDIGKKDIEKWAMSDATIDKYRDRYREEWRSKLDEVVTRMLSKLELNDENV
jgi:predicted nucleotidyltransferase